MNKPVIGFAMCGSFCTFASVIPQIELFKDSGFDVIPIMSPTAYSTDTRFGKAEDFIELFNELPKVDAGLAASIFHFGEVKINELKEILSESGIPVRK